MRQMKFGFACEGAKEFGGSLSLGKRKTKRPLSIKKPLFLTLKSSKASFFNPKMISLEKTIKDHAKKYQMTVYQFALNWNHIHFAIKVSSRENYVAFIRTLTASLVRILSKIKGRNLKGLFDLRPHTKIITWGKQFRILIEYIILNQQEALGLIRRAKATAAGEKRRAAPV